MRVRALALAATFSLLTLSTTDRAGAQEPPAVPDLALGVSADSSALLFFDPVSGRTKSGLANAQIISDITYSAVARRGFFVDLAGGVPRIKEISPHKGVVRTPVAEGANPSLGGGGNALVYSFDPDGSEGRLLEGIAVRDLGTGGERRFPGPPLPEGYPSGELAPPAIDALTVSPDGTRVAFTYFDFGDVHILDTRSDESPFDAAAVLRSDELPGVFYHAPRWLPDGRLGLIASDRPVAYDPDRQSVEDLGYQGVDGYEPAEAGAHVLMRSGVPVPGRFRYYRVENGAVAGSLDLQFRDVSW